MPAGFKLTQGFTPKSITGCRAWFDANDQNSITLSGTSVVTVLDKSGNGNTLSGGNGWSYNVTKFNGIYPSFYRATTGSMLGQNNTFSLTSSNITLFVVGMLESSGSTTSQVYFIDGGGVNTGRFYNWVDYSSGLDNVNIYHGDTQTTVFYPIANRRIFNPFILSQSTGTSPQTGSINGIEFNASSGNIGSMTVTGLTIGGPWNSTLAGAQPYTWPGHICEVILYNTALTTAQREQVEGYLAQKWGLVSQMPESHISKRAVIYPSVRKPNTLVPYYTQFSPKSIPGCILWLDGADTSTMTFISGNVSQWNDKSGKGYNATTPAGTNSPFYNTATRELQFLEANTNVLRIAQGFGDDLVGTTYSIFFIGRRTTASGFHFFLGSTGNGASRILLMIGFFNNNMQTNVYGPGFDSSIPAYTSPDPVRIYCYELQSSSLVTHIMNGTQVGSDTQNYILTSFANPELGRRYGSVPHTFNLSEMIAFSPALTAPQRQQVESYLAQKWNLSASLPSDHINRRFPVGVPSGVANILAEIPRGVKSKRLYGYHPVYNPTPRVVSARSFFGGGNYLYGIDVDRTGTYAYTVSRNGNDVNRITLATNAIVRVGGGGGGGYAGPDGGNGVGGLYRATGLVIGSDGHIYIAEYASGRIRKLDLSTNVLSSVAGNPFGSEYQCNNSDGTGAAAGLCFPNDITYDSNHVLYFTESHRVRSCTRAGVVVTIAGSGTSGFVNDTGTASRFNGPYRIACDRVNNFLYIADTGNQAIRKYVIATGVVTTFATNVGGNPLLDCDEEGILFVGNQSDGIRAYKSNGTYTTFPNTSGYTSVGNHVDMVLSYDKKTVYIVQNADVIVYALTLSTVVA